MADITLRNVTKQYPNGYVAVRGVDLDVADGEFLVLVGPSGCGKSTVLRMIAGLEEVTGGEVFIGGRDVTDLAPKDRDIAMVFQSYALYPHMTVRKNIGYPLKLAKVDRAEIDRRVEDAARLLQLGSVLERRPAQLSGGQRQRVAMGRAIVRAPRAFLMDEPLSNLDAKLRVQMRTDIAKLQRDLGVTTIYVTHDQVEAMTMGTRVAVLEGGHVQQCDEPQRLYERPINLFVAAFIGSPAMNLFAARLDDTGRGLEVSFGPHRLPVDDTIVAESPGIRAYAGRPVVVGLRPEAFSDLALDPGAPPERVIEVPVALVEALGAELVAHASAGVEQVEVGVPAGGGIEQPLADGGDDAGRHRAYLVARLSPKSRVVAGSSAKLAVDVAELQLFDPDSGASLRVGGAA
jgi:multiple sugar transport system ATP-binding protein